MHKAFSRPLFSLKKFLRTPHLPFSFKTVQDASYPRERIKIDGFSLEIKLNLNSNANQLIPIHLGVRREGARLLCAWKNFMRNSFSCKIWGAKRDKDKAHGLVAHSNSNFLLNLNGQPTIFIHPYGTQMWGVGRPLCGRKCMRSYFSWIQIGTGGWGDAGR